MMTPRPPNPWRWLPLAAGLAWAQVRIPRIVIAKIA